jgi:DNA-binding transcriptional MerR regulator
MTWSVGEVSGVTGVTVRTLHHYDHIGLLRPSGRTPSGYREYDDGDLDRLHRILAYRALGMGLAEISALLDHRDGDGPGDTLSLLRRQYTLLVRRIQELQRVAESVRKTMEAHQMGIRLDPHEMFEVFGDNDPTRYAEEVEQRWGGTDAHRESARRAATYTKEDWLRLRTEAEAAQQAMVATMEAGLAPDSEPAMDAAEAHRLQIDRWFYPCSYRMQLGLAQMYLSDPRFTATYENVAPGLARYLHDAIVANARRHGVDAG